MEYMGTTIVQPFCCLQKKKKKTKTSPVPIPNCLSSFVPIIGGGRKKMSQKLFTDVNNINLKKSVGQFASSNIH
jgi:hypothetical protein